MPEGPWAALWVTVCGHFRMPVQQVGLIQAVQLLWSERSMLEKEARRAGVHAAGGPGAAGGAQQAAPALTPAIPPAVPPAVPPAGQPSVQPAVQPSTSAAPSVSQAGRGPGGSGFVTRRVAPAPAAPSLASVGQLPEHVEVRGVCDGCGEAVLSSDEGRKREGNKYYHGACVRGDCGGCGMIVHAESERLKLSGVYWHQDCA